MKTKFKFEYMDMGGSLVAVPVGAGADLFHGVLKVNDTGMAILKNLEQDTSEEQIVYDILKEYEGDPEQIRGYVHEFLETLRTEGIVD